jgi:hypothetical protein
MIAMPWRKKDPIDQAVKLREPGYVAGAATLLWNERLSAVENDDAERVEQIDGIVSVVRSHPEADQHLAEFDALVSGDAIKIDSAPTQSAGAAASTSALTSDSVHAQRQPIVASETCMVFATVVAIITWLNLNSGGGVVCSVDRVVRGANIGHALTVAVLGGLLVSTLIPLVRRSPSALAAVLLLGVLSLGVALAFVHADAASWQAIQGCVSFFGATETPVTNHLYYLYILWGLPLLVLASQAAHLRRA